MRMRLVLSLLLISLTLSSSGCTYWMVIKNPELWGKSLPEVWEYQSQKAQQHMAERERAQQEPVLEFQRTQQPRESAVQ